MDGFWERTGEFLGRLVFAAAYMALMAVVGHLPVTFIVLFCVSIVILDFVCIIESGEKVRMVFFCVFSALLVVSAAVYHCSVLADGGTVNALQNSYFAVCAALSFFIWFEICRVDAVFCYIDLIVYVVGGLLGLLSGIFANNVAAGIVFLIIGLVFVVLLPLMRFVFIRESAFLDISEFWSARESRYSGGGFSSSIDNDTAQRIRDCIDGMSFSYGGGKYFTAHYDGGSIKVAMSGFTFDPDVGAYKSDVKHEIEQRLSNRGLPVPSIVFYD